MRSFGVVLFLIFALNSQSAAQKFPEYPVRNASQYSSCQTKNGISVAIEPVSEGKKQKKHFGTKFESQGFLPILIVVENGTASNGLMLRRDSITYQIGDDQTKGNTGPNLSVGSKSGQGVAVGAGVALATVSVVGVAVPAMFIGLKMIAAASEVKQNILVKELRSQTIAPGKAGSGFLYIPVGKPGTGKRKVTLNIPLSLGDSQEPLVFTFDLEARGGGNEK
jgi:hypothetical protein